MKRKLLALFMAIIMCVSLLPVGAWAEEPLASGSCGDDLTWALYPDGELRISVNGKMDDFAPGEAPWYTSRDMIQSISLDSNVWYIGSYAFQGINFTGEYVIPDTVIEIGECAFYGTSGMERLSTGDGLTSLNTGKLTGCTELRELHLGKSISDIDLTVHGDLSALETISVDADNGQYTAVGGVLYTKNMTTLVYCPEQDSGDLTVPNGVETVNASALFNNVLHENVVLPYTVSSIGSDAFKMSMMSSLRINGYPESVDDAAFEMCTISDGISVPSCCRDEYEASEHYDAADGTWFGFELNYFDCEHSYENGVCTVCGCEQSGTATIVASGYCGGDTTAEYDSASQSYKNLSWTLDSEYKLTISGEGEMMDYSSQYYFGTYVTSAPWRQDYDFIGSVMIGDSVTSIGKDAFFACCSLTSVVIGNSVQSIGNDAFFACNSLTSVTIGNSVTSIGESAFYGCWELTSVTIPDSVQSIGGSAFYNCSSLTSVTIPDSVQSIGDYAFSDCSGLLNISASENNKSFTSIDGVLFSKDKKTLICCPGGKNGAYTIPDSVMSIEDYAFACCSGLTSVTIPDSVESIGFDAFEYCSSLTSVTIGNGITDIGADAFDETALYNDANNWEAGVLYIGDYLIEAKNTISGSCEIKQGTKLLALYAFSDCSSLTSVTIPDSVQSIGIGAFYGCSKLTSAKFEGNAPATFGSGVFYSCAADFKILAPRGNTTWLDPEAYDAAAQTWHGYPIEFYGDEPAPTIIASGYCGGDTTAEYDSASGAYKNLSWTLDSEGTLTVSGTGKMNDYYEETSPLYSYWASIISVVIGDSVESIGNYAFADCSRLTSVTIPDSVQSIGELAFSGCYRLTSVTIPDRVQSIGNFAFAYCSSLTSVTIGDSVQSIGNSAFRGCRSLTSVTIPDSVQSIGELAFSGCSSLTAINVDADNAYYTSEDGVLFNKDKTELVCCPGGISGKYIIPDSVQSIGDWAFCICSSLTSVTIPDSVQSIGNYAFQNCSSLTSVTIPDSVQSIGDYAFNGCSGLTSATIGDSVQSIGEWAFAECSSLTSVTIGDSVQSIGNYAFSWCSSLTSVTIPDSVQSIGDRAFLECSSLTSVTIGDGVQSIGVRAFRYCSSLTSVTIPDSVQSIGEEAFEYCSSLTSAKFEGNAPATFGSGVFNSCAADFKILAPAGNTTWTSTGYYDASAQTWHGYPIEFYGDEPAPTIVASGYCGKQNVRDMFWKLDNTGTITVSGTGDMYEFMTPMVCRLEDQVKNVVVENGVTGIGMWTFYGARNLKTVTLPASVQSIRYDAFLDCDSLTDVYFYGTETQWNAINIEEGNGALRNANIHFVTEHTHVYSETVIAPTCTEGGCTIHTCTMCGDSFTDAYTPTVPHSYTSVVTSPTCKEMGYTTWTCTMCGDSYRTDDTPTVPHSYRSVVTSPTCTEEGYTTYTCYKCGDSFKGDFTPALGHNIVNHRCTRCSANDYVASGTCGATLGWALLQDGTLELSGYFSTDNFSDQNRAPWYSYRDEITSVLVGENVTAIGSYAFFDCANIRSVTFKGTAKVSFAETTFNRSTAGFTIYIPENSVIWADTEHYDATAHTWYGYPTEAYEKPPEIIASGECGENLTWKLDENGLMTVSGNGPMTDYKNWSYVYDGQIRYTYTDAPWYSIITSIKNIVIENGVTTIGNYAFRDGANIVSVDIPDSVKDIGDGAFYGCSSLKSVVIPDNMTYLGREMFYNCSSLGYAKFKGSCPTSYNTLMFSSYPIGFKILVPWGNTTWTSTSAYDASAQTWHGYPIEFYGDAPTPSIIASGYCGAEGDGTNLRWTLDRDGLLTISGTGKMADYYNMFYYPGFVTDAPWGQYSASIKSAVIDPGVQSIGDYVFYNCSNLTDVTIPDGVTSIGDDAFSGCSNLTGITIPDGVTIIGDDAFSGCSNLTGITIPDSVTSIGDGAFSNCSSLTSVTIPASVTNIGGSAFHSCSNLVDVSIPCSVKVINNYTFSGCEKLKRIEIPEGVTLIDYNAFSNCTSLSDVKLPSTLEAIEYEAFERCSALKSINLPESLDMLGMYVFLFSGLETVYIPKSVSWIQPGAFAGCENLTKITVSDENPYFRMLTDLTIITKDGKNIVNVYDRVSEYSIPDGITGIYIGAFAYIQGLTEINIPESVTNMDPSAVMDCEDLVSIRFEGDAPSYYAYYGSENFRQESIFSEVTDEELAEALAQYLPAILPGILFLYNNPELTIYAPENNATWKGEGFDAETQTWCGYPIVFYSKHTHSYSTVVTAPTCTEAGYTTYTCFCGDSYRDNYTAALGHNIVEGFCTRCMGIPINAENFPDVNFRAYVSLKSIDKDGNKLLTPSEIAAVKQMDVSNMSIRNINGIRFFTSLARLDCSGNEIKQISDTLPATLVHFDCSGNRMSHIPVLPTGLEYLDCSDMVQQNGKIELPMSLRTFICKNSHLAKLPELPDGLTTLDCSNNELSSIAVLPAGLEHLDCSGNHLRTVKFAGTDELTYVNVSNNKIASKNDALIGYAWDEVSFIFGTQYTDRHTETTNELKNVTGETATEVKTEVQNIEDLKDALENDETAVDTLKELEESLGETAEKKSEIADFDVNDISIIGASLNDKQNGNNKIELSIGVAADMEEVPVKYENAVTFSMKLDNAGTTPDGKLRVPVVITLPVPEGLNPNVLVILHYHEGNPTPEEIFPTISYEDGKCFATFVLDSFSNFAMAENAGHEHQWTEASCTELSTCLLCGNTRGELAQHTAVDDARVEPTCTVIGCTAGSHCSECGVILTAQEILEATGHNYSSVITNPTCTGKGFTTYTCSCGDSYVSDYTDATGHSYGEAVFSWAADGKTCTAKCVCSNDASHVLSGSAAVTSKVKTPATCTAKGTTTYTATVTLDGKQYTETKDVVDIPAKGHSYGAPTFTWNGYSSCTAVFGCAACSDKQSVACTVTSAVTKAATTFEAGVRTYTATVTFEGKTYTDTKTETIPKLDDPNPGSGSSGSFFSKLLDTIRNIFKSLFGWLPFC